MDKNYTKLYLFIPQKQNVKEQANKQWKQSRVISLCNAAAQASCLALFTSHVEVLVCLAILLYLDHSKGEKRRGWDHIQINSVEVRITQVFGHFTMTPNNELSFPVTFSRWVSLKKVEYIFSFFLVKSDSSHSGVF